MEEAGSGHEFQSQHTNVGCLAVLSVPGNLGLSMSMRIRPICKVYIHTYLRHGLHAFDSCAAISHTRYSGHPLHRYTVLYARNWTLQVC
jgi:hypothetical protein